MINNEIYKSILQFSKVTLEEMDKVKLMNRIETKFVFSVDQLPEIFRQLHDHYRVVHVNDSPLSSYKTVYFDTEDYFFYREHHRQRPKRSKVRFRNYVDSGITFLEVKHKNKGRTEKQRISVENENFQITPDQQKFLKLSNIAQTDLRKSVTNSYKRITLVAKDAVERVTFDIDIQYELQSGSIGLGKVVIAELKQPNICRTSPIYIALRKAQIKPSSLSKYCLGIIKVIGKENIKYNRFKNKLIEINKINRG